MSKKISASILPICCLSKTHLKCKDSERLKKKFEKDIVKVNKIDK